MFASRTDWSLTPNRLSALIDERRAKGLRIVDLTESNPTRCGFIVDAERVLAALANPLSLTYEPDPRGLLYARQAVARYYGDRGVSVHPEQIFLTTSTSEAYSHIFRLLANPGDNILVPRPSYPLFEYLARLNDVELVPYQLNYDLGWQIDGPALASRLDTHSRAVLVVHPNNPTGSFVCRDELTLLIDCCRKQPLALIADEVFADYTFTRWATPSLSPANDTAAFNAGARSQDRVLSFAAESRALTFTLSGLSKISALPQMKLAWVVVNGPEELLPAALARLEIIADTYLSVSAPLASAVPELLELRHQVQPQILRRVQQNLRWVDERLSRGCSVSRLETEGGWYLILRLPAVRSDEDWAIELLRGEGVLVHPGHFYDFPGEGHVVLSLLPFPELFQEGMLKVLARSAIL
jgi:aspartate/methionine/tyrosine aminotransferase